MAEPQGSLAHPVQQDPFQQIVNVHWRDKSQATHVAFLIVLQRDNTDLAFHSEPPPAPEDGTFPPPPNYYGGEHYVSTAFRYYSGSIGVGQPFTSPWAFIDGEWFSALSGISIEGMPVNEVSPFWFDRTTFGEDERAAGTGSPVSWNWIDPGGGEIDIPVPGWPLINFKAGIAGIEMNGDEYTGNKFAYGDGSNPAVWLYEAAGPTDRFLENFPPALTIEFLGNSYSVIGAKVVPTLVGSGLLLQPRDSAEPNNPGVLWVLAERITS